MNIPGTSILSLRETDSTNACAIRLLRDARPVEGTVIITEIQTNGRGMESNRWESAAGENLTLSLILYPSFLPVERQFRLNQAISLGICDLVKAKLPGIEVSIKWPNDIYLDNRKVCGILIQNSILGSHFDYVIAGIGLNVNQTQFPAGIPNPVSLQLVSGRHYDLPLLLSDLLQHLNQRYDQLCAGDIAGLQTEYLDRLYRKDAYHEYEIREERKLARITGLSEFGQLVLADLEGTNYICDLKEVKYL